MNEFNGTPFADAGKGDPQNLRTGTLEQSPLAMLAGRFQCESNALYTSQYRTEPSGSQENAWKSMRWRPQIPGECGPCSSSDFRRSNDACTKLILVSLAGT